MGYFSRLFRLFCLSLTWPPSCTASHPLSSYEKLLPVCSHPDWGFAVVLPLPVFLASQMLQLPSTTFPASLPILQPFQKRAERTFLSSHFCLFCCCCYLGPSYLPTIFANAQSFSQSSLRQNKGRKEEKKKFPVGADHGIFQWQLPKCFAVILKQRSIPSSTTVSSKVFEIKFPILLGPSYKHQL